MPEETQPCDLTNLTCKIPHEVKSCYKYGCDPQTCSYLRGEPCPEYIANIPNCRCCKGYYRGANGNCVTKDQCS